MKSSSYIVRYLVLLIGVSAFAFSQGTASARSAGGTVIVSISDTAVVQMQTFDLPIRITDVTSMGIISAQWTLNFNPKTIEVIGVLNAGTITGNWGAPTVNADTASIAVAMAGGDTLTGSGILAFVRMKVKEFATEQSPLILTNTFLNEDIFPELINGMLTPIAPNIAPIFTAAMGDTTINEGQFLMFDYNAFDANGDTLRFSLQNAPSGMAIDSVSGVLGWYAGYSQSGDYNFSVIVSDDRGGSAIHQSAVTVLNKNWPPVITSYLPTTSIGVGSLFTFQFTATDPENDSLHWSAAGLPPGAQFSSAGFLQWRPVFTQAGQNFNVTFFVDDGINSASQATILTAFSNNHPPVFTAFFTDTTISEGEQLNFDFSVSDVDGDNIVFSLQNQASGMSIDPASGLFSWTPAFTQAGVHTVTVIANDQRGMSATLSVSVTVLDVNSIPFFTHTLPDTAIQEGEPLSFIYAANDDQGDSIIFGLQSQPIAGLTITPGGLLQWTPDFSQSGNHTIVVRVSDPHTAAYDTAVVTVLNVNRPPQFSGTIPDIILPVDSTLNFKYSAVDPDNDNLTFLPLKIPSGAVLQPDGLFTWKPAVIHLGKDTIIAAVNDGSVSVPDTAVVTIIGVASAEVTQTHFDFGSLTFGASKTLTATVRNNGIIPLLFIALPQFNTSPDPNFLIDTAGISTVLPGEQKTFGITYNPKTVGGHFGTFVFTTNDPRNPLFVLSLNGSAISKLVVNKRLLVDTLHRQFISMSDTVNGMGRLFTFLQQSGIQVTFTAAPMSPAGNDILLIAAPEQNFARTEIDSIRNFVANGGLLIALGNSGAEGGNDALNSLLTDTSWTTNLALNNDVVVDSSAAYAGPAVPFLTTFADTNHPYLHSVDTLVFFGSASVRTTGNAVPFIMTTAKGTVLGNQQIVRPAVVGLSKIGKGTIVVSGDADAWRVDTETMLPNISTQDNLPFVINLLSVTEDYEVKLPGKTPNEQYRLVSIPFDLENSDIGAVLKDLGGVNPLIWRLFGRFDPATGAYAEFPSDRFNTFRRGEAYWLITRGEFNISFGNSTLLPVQQYFPIRIGPGYSMIGNPFPYKVSWKNSIRDSVQNVIWKYTGVTFKAESLALEPFAGYFVKNLTADTLTIFINPEDITSLSKNTIASALTEGEWKIGISAVSGRSADEENFAGVARSAKDEFDLSDVAEPPPSPTDYLVVRFNNSNWKYQPGSYAMDFRSINDEGLYWDFDVTGSKTQSRVQLSFNRLGKLPNDFSVYVIDTQRERAMRIDETYSYEYSMEKGESSRRFRLVAGRQSYIEQNTQGIPLIAADHTLMQNYPNPFNPSTQIRYSLGHSGYVVLDVYNVLGQRIRSLANGFQSIGTYSVEWDGKDDRGITLATGVYFYTINVTSNSEKIFTSTQKMILMK